jgi:acetyl esterase/lipase
VTNFARLEADGQAGYPWTGWWGAFRSHRDISCPGRWASCIWSGRLRPHLNEKSLGLVDDSPGLTPERLLSSLRAAFKGSHEDNWRKNPSRWSDSRLGLMPPTVFALARHDVLKPEAIAFMHRMRSQGVHVFCDIFDGIHQVKDMDQVTQAGRQIRQFVLSWCACVWRSSCLLST